jgi:hypothetical protein
MRRPTGPRSIVGGCIGEKRTSLNVRAGLHVSSPACVTLVSPMLPARSPNMQDRNMLVLPSEMICDDHVLGDAFGSLTLYIAAAVNAAYAQNPPAMAIKNPIVPRLSP